MIYDRLKLRRENIIKKWKEKTLENYLHSAFRSFVDEKDRFGNPVVYNTSHGLETIFDELVDQVRTVKTDKALEDIIKIKSLQVEKPSEAVEFIVHLKDIVKDDIGSDGWDENRIQELYAAIDRLTMDGFDLFMKCREKIYEIRTKEIQKRSYNLLQRANVSGVASGQEGEMDDDGN